MQEFTLSDGAASMELGVNISEESDTSNTDLDAAAEGVSTTR